MLCGKRGKKQSGDERPAHSVNCGQTRTEKLIVSAEKDINRGKERKKTLFQVMEWTKNATDRK